MISLFHSNATRMYLRSFHNNASIIGVRRSLGVNGDAMDGMRVCCLKMFATRHKELACVTRL